MGIGSWPIGGYIGGIIVGQNAGLSNWFGGGIIIFCLFWCFFPYCGPYLGILGIGGYGYGDIIGFIGFIGFMGFIGFIGPINGFMFKPPKLGPIGKVGSI